jgi:hypothetical protein
MVKSYCTQNNGDCSTCSLTSYNRDCQNNPIHGGPRPGAGRKPTGRKQRSIWLTDEEYEKVKEFVKELKVRETPKS